MSNISNVPFLFSHYVELSPIGFASSAHSCIMIIIIGVSALCLSVKKNIRKCYDANPVQNRKGLPTNSNNNEKSIQKLEPIKFYFIHAYIDIYHYYYSLYREPY